MSKEIFALDIGTRKVMGIIARKVDDALEILDVEVAEHPSRPMFDGQIHSIEEVAKTVKKIKDKLESRSKLKLSNVGVAVAGRSLITYRSKVTKGFTGEEEVTLGAVRDLELEAVEKIISESGHDPSEFYCVGYSPMYYELNGLRISNLVGHRGKSISSEVIVTFLPRVVLDSMFTVLKKSGLHPTNITLEPIAAIKAIIPEDMRSLNIILVDIGAGTSDLALTREGFVFAYGMVPEAGDEITERLSEILLTDFSTTERIKRSLADKERVEFEDIWGNKHRMGALEIKQDLAPAVKKLSDSISRTGKELNGGLPNAVVVVGGGSQTPGLIEALSSSFGFAQGKVGIRLPGAIKGIKDMTAKLNGPETITPIGIALMTAHSLGLKFIEIEVNGKKFKMLDFQQKKDIMGALTLSGAINHKRLYPRPGMAMTCELNGELKIIKGTMGEPAKILLNGKSVSSLSEKINDADRLEFENAVDGKDANILIKDLISSKEACVVFNNEISLVSPVVYMDEQEVSMDTAVCDRASIKVFEPAIKSVLKARKVPLENISERQVLVNINGNPKVLTQRNFTLTLNGNHAELDTIVKPKDAIEFSFQNPTSYRIKDIVNIPEGSTAMHVNVDGSELEMIIESAQVYMNGQRVSPDEFVIDGADIKVYYPKDCKVFLSEIFRYIQLDPQKSVGKRMKILINGDPAGFTTPLTEGAQVKIIFEERKVGG